MAITKDDIQFCISRFIKFSINSCWNQSKNHPFVSFTLLFFTFLYTCFPWFFWALIHLLAFLILVGSITRIYNKSPLINNNINNNNNNNTTNPKQNVRPIVRARSVRQRKSRETSRNTSLQNSSEDEKNIDINNNTVDKSMVTSSTTTTTRIDDKNPLLEENAKEIQVEECSVSNDKPNIIIKESQKFVNGCGEVIVSESSEEDEREREENNKAVQWTADDEKNLMDLGFSEMERNKRLESLIARRRARKMMSLQIRRTPTKEGGSSSVIAPIAIPNTKPLFITDFLTTPMPGSAPSVLLPSKDPFDIPYDPFEEKPDLTGGSFDQDFIAPDPKDPVFSRHDSFTLGYHHPWPQISFTNNRRAPENPNTENNDTDKMIDMDPMNPCTDRNRDRDSGGQMEYDLHDSFSSPRHKPTNSIASDLQVEVSEVSSPPQSNSSLDIGSSIEEDEVTSDITYGNEATWEISSRPSRNDDLDENLGFSRRQESMDNLNKIDHPQNKQFDENDASNFPETTQRESEKQEQIDEPRSIEDKNSTESIEVNERVEHTTEDTFSGVTESFGPQAVELLQPTPALQEESISSPITSPISVLQPKLSMDQSSISNTTEDMHSEIQQLDTQIVENNMAEKVRGESSTSAIPLNATPRSSSDGVETKGSQESSQHSSSEMQTETLQHSFKTAIDEGEITQNETREIPESSMENITTPITLVDLQKPVEATNDNSVDHYTHEISPAMADPNEQLHGNTQLVNIEEFSHLSKSGMEVNSPPCEPKSAIAEDEGRRPNTMEVLDSTSTIANPEKLTEEKGIDPSTLDKSHEPHEDVPPPSLANPNQQGV